MTKIKCLHASLIFALALFFSPVWAQKNKTAQDKAINDVCACYQKLNASKMSEAQKSEAGQKCMLEGLTPHIIGLAQEYGIPASDLNEETGRKIGEKFGITLIEKCPAALPFLMSFGQTELAKGNNASLKQAPQASSAYGLSGETEGILQKIDTEGEFVRLQIKTIDGDIETFYWIRPFDGSAMLEDKPTKHLGKKVLVGWQEFKRYVPSVKGYGKEREISSLLLLN
ncbi:MAG: hypothetical protein ACK4NS_07955 [Saprospiraceae bacterium]